MKKSTEEIIQIIRNELPQLKSRFRIKTLEIFGSYIRGDQTMSSDLDLLVTFTENPGLLEFLKLENFLSDLLALKVDLVMKDSLKPGLGKYILKEAQLL